MKKPTPAAPRSRQIISRQLRSIILDSGQTAYALARDSGIDAGQIQRFLNEERDIKLETLDRLAEVLGLRLVETGRSKAKPSRVSRPMSPRAHRLSKEPVEPDSLPPAEDGLSSSPD